MDSRVVASLKGKVTRFACHGSNPSDRWLERHSEPSIEELIGDPIAAALRRRDAIGITDVMTCVRNARACLTA
ncbi:hypothetical protein CKO38_17260 [Rhodospirillum rubrum]|uniref:hypothetical protein n=1 Tax=Rhodospirillum rubrum TaxID=1085 RepID=UPI0019073BD6|nr:hypothetical protein [Rhodospirillum rubrum]MBK1666239.1 hypothetical protein [Rhodospirillum rubrum]MBK1678385.1 hypothetical protein [Rhodospirillum rubrum]